MFLSHSDVKRAGLSLAKANADLQVVLKNPQAGDNYATLFGKVIAQATFTSTDMAINTVGNDEVGTINGKADVDQSDVAADTDDLCMALVDTVNSKFYYIVDAVDKAISNDDGETISWNAWSITVKGLALAV